MKSKGEKMTQKILIVVDMQNDFISGSLGTAEARRILPAVCEKICHARAEGRRICFTRDTHSGGYLETQEGKRLPVTHCVLGTEGWELSAEIAALVLPEDKIWDKNTFGSKELALWLAEENAVQSVEEVELVGLCTDICVISNALLVKAFLPETIVSVDGSCCAGVTPESHGNALAALKTCQVEVKGLS